MDVSGRILRTWMPAIHAGMTKIWHFHILQASVSSHITSWCNPYVTPYSRAQLSQRIFFLELLGISIAMK
jgi:hypothetical protein